MSKTAAMGIPKLDAGPQKSVRMLIERDSSDVRCWLEFLRREEGSTYV